MINKLLNNLYSLTYWMENMEEKNRFYTYKDKIYYSWGVEENNTKKFKSPETGEWFDAVQYQEVEFFKKEGTDEIYFRTYGGDTYYREVNDFKKKFKQVPKRKMKGWKEIY